MSCGVSAVTPTSSPEKQKGRMSPRCADRLRTRRFRLGVIACALACLLFGGPRGAWSQGAKPPAMGSAGMTGGSIPSSTPGAGPKPAETGAPKENSEPPAASPTPRPLPPAAAAHPAADNGIPPFHLASLTLDGEVTGDRAVITALIDVDINRNEAHGDSGESHDVPLRLTQAHVLSKEYTGPGQEGPVVDGPVEDGITWRFTGYGTHHLKLKMWVPIRQSPAGQQLVLSLPTMPPGFDAQLNLSIPGSLIVVRASRELSVLSNDRVSEVNKITANVRGPRLDLTWSEPPEVQTSFLQATTSITLHREADRVIATAEQMLFPENVGVKEAEIKLPDGFELRELTGTLVKGHEAILGRTGWRKVSFRETNGERIDLNWVLSAPFAAEGGALQFDGLVVPDARSQTGRIRLQEFPGYQLVPRPGEFVRRVPPTSPQTAEAFEFTKQPFRIAWDVQRVVPKFSVRPRHLLFVGATQLTLETRFRFQTDAGSIDQISIDCGPSDAEGWRLDPASVTDGAIVSANEESLNQKGWLLIGWKTPQSGEFDLNLRFVKPVPAARPSTSVTLPRVPGGRSLSAELLVAAEDQFEVQLTGAEGAALSPIPVDSRLLERVAPALVSQIQKTVRLDPEQALVHLDWKTQMRLVNAEAEVELRRAAHGRVRVQQTVHYRVRFGRLSAVRFSLPQSLAGLIPSGAGGAAIGVTLNGQTVVPQIRDGVLEAPLAEPQLGEILATLDYSMPSRGDSKVSAVVPVLSSLDAPYASTRVRIPEGEALRVLPSAEGWQPVPTSPDATVWVSSSATQVPVTLDADQTTSPRFSVDRAFYRTRIDTAGRIEGVCEFHWAGDVRGLPVTLPPESELLGAMFNGKHLDATQGQIVVDAQHPSQFLFRIPPAPDGSRLALLYRSLQSHGFSHRDIRSVALPQLPPDVSVVRSIWELELPVGRHLFIGPGDLTPEHEWQRSGFLWARAPLSQYLVEREQATIEARQLTTLSEPGQVYAFSSIGPIEAPRFQSMTRSLIVLLGAGLTLALGFLFWSLPVIRHMLSLLLLAFGVSLLSLWFLEPIQLLLQPALLGAVLALLASLVDLKSRRSALGAFPPSVLPSIMPIPPQMVASEVSGAVGVGRGSSVERYRNTPMPPTAIYQPGTSEVGRP